MIQIVSNNLAQIIMKKIFFLFVLAMLNLTFYSCKTDTDDLWDSIHQLDERVVALEEMCKQMNGNIGSLQVLVSALQNNNSVTAVIPVKQGDKTIGYTISFAKGDPITIYHGAKGEQGDKGDDGTTPIIGVKRHTDGIYYWTLNGDWLRDNNGKMIKAEGKDGTDGEQGGQGSPGITPQLKIENGYWWVSYGNNSQWIKLDKAILDSGESIFKKVAQDSKYAYFTLKDGTVITIQKYQKLSITFTEGDELKFDANETKTVHYTIKSEGSMNVVKADMLNDDNRYSLHTDIIDDTSGTITITASIPTVNQVIVRVSNAEVTIMAAISLKPSFTENTINVLEAGTLGIWLDGYDKTTITALKITGPLNSDDIATIKGLSQLTILDLENADLEELPSGIFSAENSKLLISIILPKTLKKIGDDAFYNCSGLKGNLEIPSSVISIGRAAFYNCSGLRGELKIPSGVTSIGGSAFSGCSGFTGELTLPPSITSIEAEAFSGCSGFTGELNLPSGITSIEARAFYNCSGLRGELKIPSGVTSIGGSAFSGCSGFTGELTLPSGITSIGGSAFSRCSGFTGELTLPSGITSIGGSAFWGCSGFTGELRIPLGVTSIESGAFSGCSGLKGLVIPPSVTSIGEWAFYECSGFTGELNIPSGVTSIGGSAFSGCSGFTGELNIPSGVTSIGGSAFSGCSGFTGELNIPSGITSIEAGAFSGCSGLKGLVIPPSVTSIGRWAFNGCSGFTGDLNLPSGVTSIEDFTFNGCSGFTGDLNLPSGITSIGVAAFRDCSGFTGKLDIPSSVISIEGSAFDNCKGLSPIYCRASIPPSVGYNSFANTSKLYVPKGCASVYRNTNGWNKFESIVEF